MYRFWDTIVEPLFKVTRPDSVVEIGSDRGVNTRNLLKYCEQNDAKLHVVDPLPKYDVSVWKEEYGDCVEFYSALSLNALSRINDIDAVLIDGDHNWYTVINELRLIQRRCESGSGHFPLVFLHDIGWPYGRRDLYYNPENIPDFYRKPYKRKGLRPGAGEPLEKGGLNSHLCNAIYENDLQNGVLSAVEDFLKETRQRLELVEVSGLHGLGILVPSQLKEESEELRDFLEALKSSATVRRHLERVEEERLETELRRQEAKESSSRAEVEKLGASQREEVRRLRSELRAKTTALQAKGTEVARVRSQWNESENRLSKELDELAHLTEDFRFTGSALLSSGRWRLGHAVGEALRKVTLRPSVPMAADRLNKLSQEFQEWRSRRGNSSGDSWSEAPTVKRQGTHTPSGLPSVDIVVCVHDALDDVRSCLDSIVEKTSGRYALYLVDDGSGEATSRYLREFSSAHESCVLIENPKAEGYTRAANRGLRASSGDYVVLLNSDTIVPGGWVGKLLECGESDPRIGIIGPLSNAASWQSVPELHENGDWATNPLPEGLASVDRLGDIVGRVSERRFPRVAFVNGFCLAIKRAVIDEIGYLDEESFPDGYGEENDYCLRAAEAGFELAIADHAYIYHAKSKSYTHERRRELARQSSARLKRKHGEERISRGVELLRNEPTLEKVRAGVRSELERISNRADASARSPFRVLFLLPARPGGGGTHSIVQEVGGMSDLGIFARVAVPDKHREGYLRAYPGLQETFYFFESEEALTDYARDFEVVVATVFTSVKLLRDIRESNPQVIPAYYIQDYEPWFSKTGSENEREAKESYTLIPDMLRFAKTDWIRDTVKGFHEVEVKKVKPSLDHSVYYPSFEIREDGPVRISAMVRPKTPRRSPEETMQVLKAIKEMYGDEVSVTIFGCEDNDPLFLALTRDFEFENRGVLIREEVAHLLRASDVFLDFSVYQAFGRTGLEAMACGCAVVLPEKGGTSEYARHRENALLVDTTNLEEMADAVEELIEDQELRAELRRRGTLTASGYSTRAAAISELSLFREEIRQ